MAFESAIFACFLIFIFIYQGGDLFFDEVMCDRYFRSDERFYVILAAGFHLLPEEKSRSDDQHVLPPLPSVLIFLGM